MSDIREDFQQLLQNFPCSDFQSDEKKLWKRDNKNYLEGA